MGTECYIFPDQASYDVVSSYINTHTSFDGGGIVGCVNGVETPTNQRTTRWCNGAIVLADENNVPTGELAMPRIPEKWLDAMSISQAERDLFMTNTGLDQPGRIRFIESSDIYRPFG